MIENGNGHDGMVGPDVVDEDRRAPGGGRDLRAYRDEHAAAPRVRPRVPPNGPEAPEKILERLEGIAGSKIKPPTGGENVQAQTYLSKDSPGGRQPGTVITALGRRRSPSVADRVNLACAYAWRAFERSGKDRGKEVNARADADIKAALEQIKLALAQKPAASELASISKMRDDIEALARVLR